MDNTLSLVRFSPAWFIFMLGLTAIAGAMFSLGFIYGEALLIRVLAGAPI